MEPTVTLAGLVGMLALVKTLVDYMRAVAAWLRREPGTFASVVHRTIAYAAGTAVVFLYGASQLGDFAVPGTDLLLSDMNGWTKLIVGLAVGGVASLTTDVIKSLDNTDSAKVPPLTRT